MLFFYTRLKKNKQLQSWKNRKHIHSHQLLIVGPSTIGLYVSSPFLSAVMSVAVLLGAVMSVALLLGAVMSVAILLGAVMSVALLLGAVMSVALLLGDFMSGAVLSGPFCPWPFCRGTQIPILWFVPPSILT